MLTRHITVGVIALSMFTATAAARATNGPAPVQARTDQKTQGQTQFNDKDRQVTSDWYKQNQAHPPMGFRAEDRLSPDQETRLQVGETLDSELQKRIHSVPTELKRQLAAPAPNYRYVAVGGHVALVDQKNQVHDIIRTHP